MSIARVQCCGQDRPGGGSNFGTTHGGIAKVQLPPTSLSVALQPLPLNSLSVALHPGPASNLTFCGIAPWPCLQPHFLWHYSPCL